MPVLFVGHGNPMNAIEENAFHRSWGELGRRLPRPRAVLCISAHRETRGVYLTAAGNPETAVFFNEAVVSSLSMTSMVIGTA
jgi:4,5-DOPA dioxygenase extradiol